MAAIDQLASLSTLIGSLTGKTSTTKTSGGKTTQQTNVSDQGIQEILNQILSGSGGVKNIGARARSSGLYNSTTEDQLLSELYTTAANKAELARSPTVTTTAPQTQVTKQQGASAGDLALGLGGAFVANQALNLGGKLLSPVISSATDSLGTALSDLLGIGGSGTGTGTGKNNIFDNVDFGSYGGFGGQTGGSDTGISTGEGYALNTSTLGNFSGGNTADSGGKGFNFGFDLDSGQGSVGVGGLGALGGLLGSALSGLTGGSMGGGSSGGSGGGTSGGSVICTALKNRGLLDKDLHAAGDKYLQSMDLLTTVGYQVWGIKIAAKIDKGHKGWIKFTLPFARSRTSLLASDGTFVDHVKYPLGTVTKFIGEPICHVIGYMLSEKKFFEVYNLMKGV